MKNNLKLKLFNFNKGLTIDQSDISVIVESHIKNTDVFSEKEILNSLDKELKMFEYFDNIENLLNDMKAQISTDQMYYDLKDLYYKLERSNHSAIYGQPIYVLLDCINTTDKTNRYEKVITELALYDWVPEIKQFVYTVTAKPEDKLNYSARGGKADSVYSLVVKNENGFLSFIKDKWFLLKEDKIEAVLLENYIKDEVELKRHRIIEQAIKSSIITENKIQFVLDEKFMLGLSTSKPGEIFINEDKAEPGTTLETLFNSPLVPFMAKGYYTLISETLKSIKSFVELDIVKKVTNILQPHLETYAFNYKNNFYAYRIDTRTGSNFFKYETASALIGDVIKESGVDLTAFYLENVDKETKSLSILNNQEINLTKQLTKIDESLAELQNETSKLGDNKEFKKLTNTFLIKKHKLLESIKNIRTKKNNILNEKVNTKAKILNENDLVKKKKK
jgi:hypothetical protein